MRHQLSIVACVLAFVCAVLATTFTIQARLPSGETAGKLALVWLPLLTLVSITLSARKTKEGSKS